MDSNLINDLDLEHLKKELDLERISFNDVANYFLNLNIDENSNQINLKDNYQQILKLIKISQILLKFVIDKSLLLKKSDNNDKYIYQCTNCSKAFRKSEYLDNHIQRRHVNSSLAHDGLFPLIEQIKKYNSGLFVESSSIDDLKEEIKNLQSCLKDTSEDLIKEKIAREQLQRIIESEIIEKLNSLQETWSIEPNVKDNQEEDKLELNNNEELNENTNDKLNNQQLDKKNQLNDLKDTKDTKDFNLFLIKQNELIDKLGKNIDRFVNENPNEESKINNEQLQNLISTAIHKEIENLLSKDILTSKDKTINKPKNNRRFLLRKDNTKLNTKENEIRRLSLHEFSIQPQIQQLQNQNLSNNNLNNMNRNDHTDEIVHEINQIVNEDNLLKTITAPIVKSSNKRFKFPFKFRKSKSLNQLAINNEEIIQKNENESNLKENSSSVEVKNDLMDKKELEEVKGDESKVVNLKEESKKELDENNTDKKQNNNDNNKPISRFRQFVSKRKDNEQDNKISLTKFSSKQLTINQTKINEDVKNDNLDKDDKQKNVKQLANQIDNRLQNGSKVLKSVLKKSNSTDSSLQNQSNKMPKRIVFNDERVEFSAEDSSDTGSSYSITNGFNNNYNFSNSYLTPTQQVVTVQKVIEKPIPAPRFLSGSVKKQQQNTLTSL